MIQPIGARGIITPGLGFIHPYPASGPFGGHATLAENLVSYWKLSDVNDAHGSNNLTNSGSTTFTTGKSGNAASFSSASSQYLYITDANQSGLDITGSLSISAWIKHVSNKQQVIGKYQRRGATTPYIFESSYAIQWFSDQKLYFTLSSNGSTDRYFTSSSTYTDTSNFHHIVVVFSAGSSMTVYFDGSSISGSVTGGVPDSIYNSSADFQIGGIFANTQQYADGLIDEVGIWSKALTSTEVGNLYASGSGLFY